MSNRKRKDVKFESFKRSIGLLNYKNYELRFIKDNELDTIHLSRLEFELLVDNKQGQQQLVNKNGGDTVVDLVALFRNSNNTTFTVCFNSKEVKIYNFINNTDELLFITELNYKKVYSELLSV